MSEASIVRRASYGPSSPAVGARGATTRGRIAEVSLELFGRVGYFDTSVDAIAKAAGVSRATLYQYFKGKDEIFLGLLNECGGALFRVARRIGPLGPDEVGFDNLNWWLGEWSWVFEKYSTMFVQWTAIASSDTKVRPEITRFVRGYNHRVAERLAASGLQLMLFPDPPPSVLRSLALHASADPAGDIDAVELPPAPDVEGLSVSERTASLSNRAVITVNALADAGAAPVRAR